MKHNSEKWNFERLEPILFLGLGRKRTWLTRQLGELHPRIEIKRIKEMIESIEKVSLSLAIKSKLTKIYLNTWLKMDIYFILKII